MEIWYYIRYLVWVYLILMMEQNCWSVCVCNSLWHSPPPSNFMTENAGIAFWPSSVNSSSTVGVLREKKAKNVFSWKMSQNRKETLCPRTAEECSGSGGWVMGKWEEDGGPGGLGLDRNRGIKRQSLLSMEDRWTRRETMGFDKTPFRRSCVRGFL